MARIDNLTNFLTDVASAIKTKSNNMANIPAANFDNEILNLPSQGNYQVKTMNITTNGETVISPDQEYDAMSRVVANVQVPMPQLQNKFYEFTSNQNITLLPDTGFDGFTDISVSINVPTGIDTSDATAVAEDILEGKTAYVNGVKLTGTMENLSNVISEQENIINNLYNLVNTKANGTGGGPFVVPDGMRFVSSKLTTFPNNMDMSKVMDMGEMFAECTNLINIPEFNTINAINMSAMFWNCTNLVEMADIDTSNVVNARNMFYNCTNLTNLPNISALKMLDASALFYNCTNLVDIPKINIINATNISHICQNCINLVNITDFTTGHAVDMSYAFCNCVNLANISSFSAYNTANMQDIFTNCNNLSADSYANIANSLPLAANLTNQYVVNLGLNIINFTDEQVIILNNKGYIDAIPKANTKGTTYNITYTI